MTAIDATGLLALEDLADKLHAAGRTLILCGARPQPAKLMRQAEFEQHVGRENICPHIRRRSSAPPSSTPTRPRRRPEALQPRSRPARAPAAARYLPSSAASGA